MRRNWLVILFVALIAVGCGPAAEKEGVFDRFAFAPLFMYTIHQQPTTLLDPPVRLTSSLRPHDRTTATRSAGVNSRTPCQGAMREGRGRWL